MNKNLSLSELESMGKIEYVEHDKEHYIVRKHEGNYIHIDKKRQKYAIVESNSSVDIDEDAWLKIRD